MEEHDSAQKPEQDRAVPSAGPEPATPSVTPNTKIPTDRERDLIEAGQRKAQHDQEELQKAGFGSHIGKE